MCGRPNVFECDLNEFEARLAQDIMSPADFDFYCGISNQT